MWPMWGVCIVVAALAGCLRAGAAPCGNGEVCAPGTVCVAALDLCAGPDQVSACSGIADGTACRSASIGTGTCSHGVCVRAGCGNGIVDPGEACDDGNTVSGDGCSADCSSNETCGNKIVDGAEGEQCDCGTMADVNPQCPGPNSDTSGPCSTQCVLRCGDGIVEADEGCDPAASTQVSCAGVVSNGVPFDRGLTTCSPSCQPVITVDTCKYLGWRTRKPQAPNFTTDVAEIAAGSGFGTGRTFAVTYSNYVVNTTPPAYDAGQHMTAVWAADANTAVAVGDSGTIVQTSDGGVTWAPSQVGTADLRDVWGRSGSDEYAIGQDTVLHWNGTSWAPLSPPSGQFRAVSGDAVSGDPETIYVAGDGGTLLSYDGVSWQTIVTGTSEDLLGVWSAPGMVVAVGSNGTIVQNDGSGWVRGRTTATANLLSVWGSAVDGFFAVGEHGTVLFYDGAVWRQQSLGRGLSGSPDQTFYRVRGLAGVEVAIIGDDDVATYEGAAWVPSAAPTDQTIYGLWASGPEDVFAVGRHGTILHHDGLAWSVQPTQTLSDLHGVWGTGPHDVYAVGDDSLVLHYDGATWTALETDLPPSSPVNFTAVLAFAGEPDDVTVIGDDGMYHYEGTTLVHTYEAQQRTLWGTDPTNIWSGGDNIYYFDGMNWDDQLSAASVSSLTGATTNTGTTIYAVGQQSYERSAGAWSVFEFVDSPQISVAASPALGVFSAGTAGTLRHWNGTDLEPFISRTTADLNALFIADPLVFMAGTDGAIEIMVFAH